MKHKMSLLALAVGSSLAAPAFADINDIVIARYLEGSGFNKAIEITNVGSDAHTFENTALYMDGNGGSYFQEINRLNGVTLAAGASIVIHHKDLNADIASTIPAGAKLKVADVSFNGDDALFIAYPITPSCGDESDCKIDDEAKKTEYRSKTHDIVGISGEEWGKDQTFVRNTGNESKPSAVFKADEWNSSAKDSPEGLGSGLSGAIIPPEPEVGVCEGQTLTPTYAIQGDGWHSPMVDVENKKYISDGEYFVQGVVVAATTGLTKGYYIQDKDGDGNAKTSDGLLVTFSGAKDEHVGQTLCFQGRVEEFYGRTQLKTTVNKFQVMDATVNKIAPTPITVIPELDTEDGKLSFRATLERYEGMLVTLPEDMNSELEGKQDMRVSRTFSFDYAPRRSNMVIAYERPNMHPNQLAAAGSEASKAAIRENQDRRVFVESDAKADSEIPYFPAWNANPNANAIRVNDSVVDMRGVLDYSYNEYRLILPESSDFIVTKANFKSNNSARQNKPSLQTKVAADEFVLRVGSKNVLNFFNSPFKGDYNSHGLNRGAESQVEFELQKAKLVEALYGMNADVVGLMEVENNGFGHYGAIKELVDALNDKYTEDRYSKRHYDNYVGNRYTFVAFDTNGDRMITAEDTVGSDAITTGLIYRPSKVTLEEVDIIPMPRQEAPALTDDNGNVITNSKGELIGSGRAYQRDSLTGTFLVHNTGKKLTVSVNHLKSKGSACWEDFQVKDNNNNPIDVDKQGNCENFRVAGAVQLGEQLAKRYPDNDRIIMGDLNSYAKEDPMLVLTSNPTNKVLTAARDTWIGNQPQFGSNGAVITRSFGYTNAVHMMDEKKGRQPSWSYSYNDEIGSLDHMLVSPGLKSRVVDAIDWNINSSETPLFDYQKRNAGDNPGIFHGTDKDYSAPKVTAFRSSDHDPVIMALSYKYAEPGSQPVRFTIDSSRVDIPFVVNADAKKDDKAYLVITSGLKSNDKPQIPVVGLKKDGLQTVSFNVANLPRGEYTVRMYLMRQDVEDDQAVTKANDAEVTWSEVAGSSKEMTIEVAKTDGISTGKVAVPSYDGSGSGGSLGGFGLLSLLTFGWLRRSRRTH
ncbi:MULTISPECIES: ExeM/NucH family extracellular endonuclease [unclassified Vibrio]|uniref:ExeM/NucH family extracellular endonuclease n=2 Tax=Vibrio TaxID=662 RepID=UPI0014822713|nr:MULTISPECIES: ExeM/NucH family extracellular endonuclease [unclassified Vibrio]NNN44385.1 ExeM/NucH family extracellular endonuclease [Vibrio sp. 1-1(7)]NNN72901.1 ExeM/NucH family extracellular endonuclease [Vibrio sp. 12-2(3-a)]